MSKFAETFFNWQVMQQYLPKIVEGFFVTIQLALAVVVTGIACGLVLAVVRAARVRAVNFFIVVFVDAFRALPPLVVIILFYFALPTVGVRMSGFVATWLALALVLTAYAEEIFWAGLLAVPKGQLEAARAIGLDFFQSLRYVMLPQAVRITIPPLTNRTIAITKNTALGAAGTGRDLQRHADHRGGYHLSCLPLAAGAAAFTF